MFGVKRPPWARFLLHGTLVLFAAVFSFPFIWMLGTSFKQDKELSTSRLSFMPRAPLPLAASPYVDHRHFDPLDKPEEGVEDPQWERLKPTVELALDEGLADWRPADDAGVSREQSIDEMKQGCWRKLQTKLPTKFWQMQPGEDAKKTVLDLFTDELVEEAFDECYRRFVLSTVTLRTLDYLEYKAEPTDPDNEVWRVISGQTELSIQNLARGAAHLVDYDLATNPKIHIVGEFNSPVPLETLKHIRIAYRQDETWHRIWFAIEMNGRLYEVEEPDYMGTDDWAETTLQETSEDDKRLLAKTWVIINPIEEGAGLESRPQHFKLHVKLQRSGHARAWWGKMRMNYHRTLRQVPFWRYVRTSVVLAILRISLTLFSCSLVAYSFARLEWPGRSVCFMLLLSTMMIPPQVTMIPQFIIFRTLGFYNTLYPLWVTSVFASAFFVFLLRQFMKGIPKDLEDASRIDGCGYLRVYWHVILPNIKPALAAIAIFTFLGSWNDFMGPLIYVNDQRMYNLALGLFSFRLESGANFGMLMAGSLIMTTPIIVIFFFAQRYFIQGVTLTGMKA